MFSHIVRNKRTTVNKKTEGGDSVKEYGIQVRLKTDLARYHPRLVVGAQGVTSARSGLWARGSDRFVAVEFPEAGTFDVLWESLDIIDVEYLADIEIARKARMKCLEHATDVVLWRGPRGGFRYLSYHYVDTSGVPVSTSCGFRAEAEELMAFFRSRGIVIEEKTE